MINADSNIFLLARFLLADITYLQRTKDEKTFHSHVKIILSLLGFKTYSELLGSARRLDLCVELPEQVFVIIELKYCSKPDNKEKEEETLALAAAAVKYVPKDLIDKSLLKAVEKKLQFDGIEQFLSELPQKPSKKAEIDQILIQHAKHTFTKPQRAQILAQLAREKLSKEELEEVLPKESTKERPPKEQLEKLLSKTAQTALDTITQKDYHSILGHKAKEIIDLGMAIYGKANKVMALFEPKKS
jgi:hypothetical protein